MGEDIEVGGKEKMLLDWVEVRNAMLRADSGEMKVSHQKKDANATGIVGITVELSLQFGDAIDPDFSDEEKALIDAAQQRAADEPK
jgi:hypothetical protein